MLKLSKKIDYGLMALMHLAQHSKRPSCNAREIAENYGIPVELLSKILQRLVQKGLLVSHAGTHGGYSLSRPADRISAAEVIEAIEGPLSLTNCVSDDGLCVQFDKCNVKSPLQKLTDVVIQTFRDLTIEQMTRPPEAALNSDLIVKPRLVTISTFGPEV